jgi:hypothetical protein
MRAVVRLAFAVAVLAASAGRSRAQERTARFEIISVTDTSLTFALGPVRWVRPGREGWAVDPRRRDALIARFRITTVRAGQADALVTGQTAPVSTEHLALLAEPRPPIIATRSFWFGVVGGMLLGFAAGRL